MKADINHVLKVYLGADENGGYEPLYCEERLRQAFPDGYAEMKRLIARYLQEQHVSDWTGDLIQERDHFERALRQKFPELNAIVARALANRWHFGAAR